MACKSLRGLNRLKSLGPLLPIRRCMAGRLRTALPTPGSSANQAGAHVLCKQEVHHRVHNSASLAKSILNLNPSSFSKTRFKIIPGFFETSFSSRFPHQNPVCITFIPRMCHMPRRSHPPRINRQSNIRPELPNLDISCTKS